MHQRLDRRFQATQPVQLLAAEGAIVGVLRQPSVGADLVQHVAQPRPQRQPFGIQTEQRCKRAVEEGQAGIGTIDGDPRGQAFQNLIATLAARRCGNGEPGRSGPALNGQLCHGHRPAAAPAIDDPHLGARRSGLAGLFRQGADRGGGGCGHVAIGKRHLQFGVADPDGQRQGIQQRAEAVVGGDQGFVAAVAGVHATIVAHPDHVGQGPAIGGRRANAHGVHGAGTVRRRQAQVKSRTVTPQRLGGAAQLGRIQGIEAGDDVIEPGVGPGVQT